MTPPKIACKTIKRNLETNAIMFKRQIIICALVQCLLHLSVLSWSSQSISICMNWNLWKNVCLVGSCGFTSLKWVSFMANALHRSQLICHLTQCHITRTNADMHNPQQINLFLCVHSMIILHELMYHKKTRGEKHIIMLNAVVFYVSYTSVHCIL